SALVMEAAAGACNSLDEYSSFLTPTHLALMQGPRKTIGVGLSLERDDHGVKIAKVWPGGPAADKQLEPNDRLISIDGKPIDKKTSLGEVEAQLKGEADKTVEVEYERDKEKKTVELTFREVRLPSVERKLITSGDQYVGYVSINYFNEETYRDVK